MNIKIILFENVKWVFMKIVIHSKEKYRHSVNIQEVASALREGRRVSQRKS